MIVKKVLISLGHPAHFQLFKNVIANLRVDGYECLIVIRKKDILEDLLNDAEIPYYNILPDERKGGKLKLIWSLIIRDIRLLKFCLKHKPDLMLGSTVEITHVGMLLRIPAISVGEDDLHVVPLFAKLAAPFSNCLVFPDVCDMGKWEYKTLKYNSYQELAYLHPNHFKSNRKVVEKYIDLEKPYFIIRFSKLNAHHDSGINGIDATIAERLISILEPRGTVYITSERELEPQFEKYRMSISPLDIHHVMAFAQLYIGDSQTMAAEAGVLGVPFVRFNDFVGRISYLKELEDVYQLGYGILPKEEKKLYQVVEDILKIPDRSALFQTRREKMLENKIDTAKFLTWFIENFPESKKTLKKNQSLIFQNFK